jgi:hypothetical protein
MSTRIDFSDTNLNINSEPTNIDALEFELNDLVDSKKDNFKENSNFFPEANLPGQTWDGFNQTNEIPISFTEEPSFFGNGKKEEESLKDKLKYLKILEKMEKNGIELSKKYSTESSLSEMIAEVESIREDRQKTASIRFQSQCLMTFVNGIEFLNNRFDPFDLNLDGWSEQVTENISDYEDVFEALNEKYKDKVSVAPEIQLMFKLGGSAVMVAITNHALKTSMPGMDEILRQNPDLMRSFQSAAVKSMSQNTPSMSKFMDNEHFINKDKDPRPIPVSQNPDYRASGPPAPLKTQMDSPTRIRPGNNTYPSLQKESKQPSQIDELLSGLKTKTIVMDSPTSVSQSILDVNEIKPKKIRKKLSRQSMTLDI